MNRHTLYFTKVQCTVLSEMRKEKENNLPSTYVFYTKHISNTTSLKPIAGWLAEIVIPILSWSI